MACCILLATSISSWFLLVARFHDLKWKERSPSLNAVGCWKNTFLRSWLLAEKRGFGLAFQSERFHPRKPFHSVMWEEAWMSRFECHHQTYFANTASPWYFVGWACREMIYKRYLSIVDACSIYRKSGSLWWKNIEQLAHVFVWVAAERRSDWYLYRAWWMTGMGRFTATWGIVVNTSSHRMESLAI